MKNSKWRKFQVIQLILFLGMSVFLLLRKVDGSGAENTLDVKVMSLAIWLVFYLLVLAIEYGIRLVIKMDK